MYGNRPCRAIRSYDTNHTRHYLLVDETTLVTRIVAAPLSAREHNITTTYQTLLERYTSPPYKLQDYGLTAIGSGRIYITTDLCPSSKRGFEREFYQKLIDHYPNPVDVTLFICSRWIDRHPEEFAQLKQWQSEKKLNIVWGNHTHSHPFHPSRPLDENFLLSRGVDIEREILELEKKLIGYGVTPSVFFRFPGLVQDEKAVLTLRRLGLIPVGTNAWLAKGEKIHKGSIILLHGNRNEHEGIKKADLLFRQPGYDIGSLLDIARPGEEKATDGSKRVVPGGR